MPGVVHASGGGSFVLEQIDYVHQDLHGFAIHAYTGLQCTKIKSVQKKIRSRVVPLVELALENLALDHTYDIFQYQQYIFEVTHQGSVLRFDFTITAIQASISDSDTSDSDTDGAQRVHVSVKQIP